MVATRQLKNGLGIHWIVMGLFLVAVGYDAAEGCGWAQACFLVEPFLGSVLSMPVRNVGGPAQYAMTAVSNLITIATSGWSAHVGCR